MGIGDENPNDRSSVRRQDSRALILLFCFFCFLYGYFFQGGGWNQNSQFDTVRALVEEGSTEITTFARNTGDIGILNDRIFSNKPPGLAFAVAPFYFVLFHAETAFGMSPEAFPTATMNAQLLTFFTSGLPGALLVLVLYRHFRRRGATVYESLCLAAAFGAGTLVFPYSGVMMNHVLTACLLFAAWHAITAEDVHWGMALASGLMAGMATITDSLAAPAMALFLVYAVLRRRSSVAPFLAGSGAIMALLLAHNELSFGNPFITNSSIEAASFKTPGDFLGVFGWPAPIRLFWLTIHPWRGLFVCCPVLILSLLSLRWPPRIREAAPESVVALLIVGYSFLFNMSFNGWTGGWGVGPRYLIPCTPFLFSFALDGYRRFPNLSRALMEISAVFMFGVAAVQLFVPSPDQGPPPNAIPILTSLKHLAAGHVSLPGLGVLDLNPAPVYTRWTTYNLGELVGLGGVWSLAPLVAAFAVFGFLLVRSSQWPTKWRNP